MAPGGNPMDKMLWRIAELGSRYSDPRWSEERAQTWAALEQIVARAGSDVAAMVVAMEEAQDRARNAEARVRAVQRDRDRHRARASALGSSLREASSAAEAALGRLLSVERQRDEALAARARVTDERDEAKSSLALARSERDEAQAALARRAPEHGENTARPEPAKPEVTTGWDGRQAPRAKVPSWWKAIPPAPPVAEPVPAVPEMEVELEVTRPALVPDESAGVDVVAQAVQRVVAEAEAEAGTNADTVAEAEGEAPAAEAQGEPTTMIDLTDHVTYLSVRATPGNLLPHDMAKLLMNGATVVRREGRLAAVIAVTMTVNEWARPDVQGGKVLADKLRHEGFRVEFIDQAIAS